MPIHFHVKNHNVHVSSPTTPFDLFPNSLLNFVPHLARRSLGLTQSLLRFQLQTRLPSAEVPVVEVPVSLHELRAEVDGVAAEEQVVGGRDGHGVAHEGTRVEGQGAGHAARDTIVRVSG
jgi:hypothetical protein